MNNHPPLSPDDPRLTAFALGELEGAEQAAVAAEVAASEALQQQVEHIRADAAVLREQLQAAESAGLSPALEARLLAALADEAASKEVDAAIAGRVLQGSTFGGQAQDSGLSAAAAVAESSRIPADAGQAPASFATPVADWRNGLGRDARHRLVWWSPFALPFAACLVGLIALGVLWKEGYRGTPEAGVSAAVAPDHTAAMRQMSADVPYSFAVATERAEPDAQAGHARMRNTAVGKQDSYGSMSVLQDGRTQGVEPVVASAAMPQSGAVEEVSSEAVSPAALHVAAVHGSVGLLSQGVRADLFAPRVWAYGHSGLAVRDSALSPSGLLPYAGEESLTVFETTVAEASGTDTEILVASDSGAPVSARSLPVSAGIGQEDFAQDSVIAASASVPHKADAEVADAALQVARQRPTAVSAATGPRSAVASVATAKLSPVNAPAPASGTTIQPVQQGSSAPAPAAAESSSRVLAEAVALVRPVAGGEAASAVVPAMSSVNDPVASSASDPSAAALTVNDPAAAAFTALPVPAAGVAPAVAAVPAALTVNDPAAAVLTALPVPAAGVAPAVAADALIAEDAEGAENTAIEATRLSASQIAALAAAKHFRQASLEELEAAAFASGGQVWRAGTGEITAAAAQVARAEQTASAGAQPQASSRGQAQPSAAPRVQNLASRYVQMKLWVDAGQLPPVSDVNVDAIVRDAAPLYAPTALRRLRAQAAAKLAVGADGVVPVAMPATASTVLTVQELSQLEAQSPLLRFVRAYAVILKERPADAVAKLDAIAAQVKARPRMAASRNGQELLALLEATRELF